MTVPGDAGSSGVQDHVSLEGDAPLLSWPGAGAGFAAFTPSGEPQELPQGTRDRIFHHKSSPKSKSTGWTEP